MASQENTAQNTVCGALPWSSGFQAPGASRENGMWARGMATEPKRINYQRQLWPGGSFLGIVTLGSFIDLPTDPLRGSPGFQGIEPGSGA